MALEEDLGDGDVTSRATIPPRAAGRGIILAKSKATSVLCGIPIVQMVFSAVDTRLQITPLCEDGTLLHPGQNVLQVDGPLRSILAGERLALNFIQRMSGVATLTRRYMDSIPEVAPLVVYDTRKTTPLWRDLERYAVRMGGGRNHRWGLHDMVMVKDTHADACGGLGAALEHVQMANLGLPVAAEARTFGEALVAAAFNVDVIMLDNMTDEEIQLAIEAIRAMNVRCEIEATGGITAERLITLARMGIQRVSVGALTHSAPSVDFSLELESPA